MNTNNFKIENNGITSIITKGHIMNSVVEKIIESNKDKKTVIWQDNNYNRHCERIELGFNSDLKGMIIENHNFDLLIINYLSEWANTKETIEFLQYIKQCDYLRDKKIVIFFTTRKKKEEIRNDLTIDDFMIFRDVILEVSNEIYLFNKKEIFVYKLQDIQGNILSYWNNHTPFLRRMEVKDENKTNFISVNELVEFLKYDLFYSSGSSNLFKDTNSKITSKSIKEVLDYLKERDFNLGFLSAESLVNEYLDSFSQNISKEELMKKYDDYEAIFLYDFQFLKGKVNCIKFVYDLLERFYKKKKQIEIVSDCEIGEIRPEDDLYCFVNRIAKYIIE